MKVSLNWLRRHVDLPESAEEVAKALTSIGLEVEGMEEPGKVYEKLIVAKVLTCDPHPDSDHLHITTVNNGKETQDEEVQDPRRGKFRHDLRRRRNRPQRRPRRHHGS